MSTRSTWTALRKLTGTALVWLCSQFPPGITSVSLLFKSSCVWHCWNLHASAWTLLFAFFEPTTTTLSYLWQPHCFEILRWLFLWVDSLSQKCCQCVTANVFPCFLATIYFDPFETLTVVLRAASSSELELRLRTCETRRRCENSQSTQKNSKNNRFTLSLLPVESLSPWSHVVIENSGQDHITGWEKKTISILKGVGREFRAYAQHTSVKEAL